MCIDKGWIMLIPSPITYKAKGKENRDEFHKQYSSSLKITIELKHITSVSCPMSKVKNIIHHATNMFLFPR
jgi:hypothetical protein